MRALLITFLFAAGGCTVHSNSVDGQYPPIRNSKPGAGTIAILGDSLAAGYGANDMHNTPAQCLAGKFKNRLSDFAVNGLTSSDTLTRVDAVAGVAPHLVFVSAGGNDVLSQRSRPGSYGAEKTLREMGEIFDRLLATGSVVAYLGLQPPYTGTERLLQISEMARQKGVIVVDGMAGFWGKNEFMFDPIHPNDKGYEIMCSRILQAVEGYYP